MNRIPFLVLALGVFAATTFAQDPVPASKEPAKEPAKERRLGLAKPLLMEADQEVYGAALEGKEHVSLVAIAKEPKAWHNKTLQLRAKIAGVCPKKGCWMTMEEGGKQIRVKFNGYKFFVPLDVGGREAAVEGLLEVKIETEAERRHYAQDAGKTPEEIAKIVGDETTLAFTADAVHIGKLPPLPKKGCCEESEKKEGCCPAETKKTEGCCPAEGKKADGGACCTKPPVKQVN